MKTMKLGIPLMVTTTVAVLGVSMCPAASSSSTSTPTIMKTPPQTSQEILKSNQYPEWFRDGKLGIWAHWGPQSVPMMGDWYARNLYIEGQADYADHLARYGHPSKSGYKDIIPLWKAEKWDPDRLMKMYKAAGAKYFVSMAVHHDNFDLWDSKYHRWNAVKMGPMRDVVGTWQRAAKKEGLHFGVSEHLGASFTWFQVARGADASGPYAGVPYDGADPAYEDLYHAKTLPGDTGWYTNNPRFQAEWFQRISDLVDHYHPDLLYSDGPIPFGHFGEDLVAHFYADSRERNDGRQEVVYTCKEPSGGQWAQDVERGVLGSIQDDPWQTDTSIGDWFYNKHWTYRHADWVIKTLVDVVSKNGNLLINVVQRPDGSLDPEAEQVLTDMTAWMKVNGRSIYGTRPWIVYGEGPIHARGGAFSEEFGFTANDIRYASKGDGKLFATMMGMAKAGDVVLRMLPKTPGDPARIRKVSLLGSRLDIEWSWQADGLHVKLPQAHYDSIASVLEIDGSHLRSITLPEPVLPIVKAEPNGDLILTTDLAQLHGDSIGTETRDGKPNIAYWFKPEDSVEWTLSVKDPGEYEVSVVAASEKPGSILRLAAANQLLDVTLPEASGWGDFREFPAGTLSLAHPGNVRFSAKPADPEHWLPINLRCVYLRKKR
jgi:alpha-L-fucosidase